ncbi:MAG TPA: lipoyl(octanoyl) transferase LipB [Nitrososphaerales archaeon]|nr:lipoyl(octanoyl) transferase LipB [Nitrososphaerales archaeon]
MSQTRVLDVGRMQYGDAWELQRRLLEERISGALADDTLIVVEHDHVITLGRKTTPENFKPQDIPVFQVERGGDATYHGPGQLVGYPIVRLPTPNVHAFVRTLEDVLIAATRAFGVDSGRVEGHTGVWVGGRKVASIGVAVSNWVTYHGFALNVNTDLSYFRLIKPCGLDPERMTSMSRVLGGDLPFDQVKKEVVSRFLQEFSPVLEQAASAPRKD